METCYYYNYPGSDANRSFPDHLGQIRMVSLIFERMAKEKNIGDIFWILLAWILAAAFVYMILVKMKILFY